MSFIQPNIINVFETLFTAKGLFQGKKIGKRVGLFLNTIKPMLGKVNLTAKVINSVIKSTVVRNTYQVTSEIDPIIAATMEKVILTQQKCHQTPALQDILNDFFQPYSAANSVMDDLKSRISKKLFPTNEKVVNNACTFVNLLQSHRSVIVVGDTMSGKSSMIKLVGDALNLFEPSDKFKKDSIPFKSFPCYSTGFNGDLSSLKKFFSRTYKAAMKHAEGFAENRNRDKLLDTVGVSALIVFDGSEMDLGIDQALLNSYNNELFVSVDGSEVMLAKSIRFVYETTSIKSWSPRKIAQCGILYLPKDHFNTLDLLKRLLVEQHDEIQQHSDYIILILNIILLPLLEFTQSFTSNIISSKLILLENLLKVFKSSFHEFGQEKYARFTRTEQLQYILAIIIFSAIWTLGSLDEYSERLVFVNIFGIMFCNLLHCWKKISEFHKRS